MNGISRPEQCQFATKVLEMASFKIHIFRIVELVPYLLLLSYLSHLAPQIGNKLEEVQLRGAEKKLTREFSNLDQTEVAVVYSALNTLSQPGPQELKQKIQDTYGFRL